MKAPDLFSDVDRQRIKSAIENAESMTSGEIRVYIEDECRGSVLDHTAFIFSELKMHNTELRNGVLIYLAVKDNKFAIIGDAGIHAKVGDAFWNTIKEDMIQHFKNKEFADGLVKGINDAGKALSTYFPRSLDDTNELSDDIIFGKN